MAKSAKPKMGPPKRNPAAVATAAIPIMQKRVDLDMTQIVASGAKRAT